MAGHTSYVARTPQRQPLRFSRSGDPALEQLYHARWISAALSERQREKMTEKANKPPELVVIDARKDWSCHRCSGSNAVLSRRVKARSPRRAVVVRFSKTRGRYERQGLLVEPQALAAVQRELNET